MLDVIAEGSAQIDKIEFNNADINFDWASIYQIDGQDATRNDVDIVVKDQSGSVVNDGNYELTITREGESREEVVHGPDFGLAKNDKTADAGFTSYHVKVRAFEGTAYTGELEAEFYIADKWSLNYICSNAAFEGSCWSGDWRMHQYFKFLEGGLTVDPTVTALGSETPLTADKYTVTYYHRGPDNDDWSITFPDNDPVVDENTQNCRPAENGNYYVKIEGTGEPGNGYYGGNDVLIDIGNMFFVEGEGSPYLWSNSSKEYNVVTSEDGDVNLIVGQIKENVEDWSVADNWEKRLVNTDDKQYYTFVDGKLTLNGAAIFEEIGDTGVDLYAYIKNGQSEFVAQAWEFTDVREAKSWYSQEEDWQMLPGEDRSIEGWYDAYVQDSDYPDGFDGQYEVTSVEIISGKDYIKEESIDPVKDEDNEEVYHYYINRSSNGKEGDEENHWFFFRLADWYDGFPYDNAEVEFKVNYKDLHGNDQSYTFKVDIVQDIYDLDIKNETGTFKGLPGHSFDMTANTYHRWIDDKGDYHEEDNPTSVTCDWSYAIGSELSPGRNQDHNPGSEWNAVPNTGLVAGDDGFANFTVSANDGDENVQLVNGHLEFVRLTNGQKADEFYVKVELMDGNNPVASQWMEFQCCDEYDTIYPFKLDDIEVGDIITDDFGKKFEVRRYSTSVNSDDPYKQYSIIETNENNELTFKWNYDSKKVKIIDKTPFEDAGALYTSEVENDEPARGDRFELQRLSDDDVDFRIVADWKDTPDPDDEFDDGKRQVDQEYRFGWRDYNIEFDREEPTQDVFSDNTGDKARVFDLNTDKIEDKAFADPSKITYEREVGVGFWNDNDSDTDAGHVVREEGYEPFTEVDGHNSGEYSFGKVTLKDDEDNTYERYAITLDGARAFESAREQEKELYFIVTAYNNGVELSSAGTQETIREAKVDIEKAEDRDVLPGWGGDIDSKYEIDVENAQYPQGEQFEYEITNIEPVGAWAWNDEGEKGASIETNTLLKSLTPNKDDEKVVGWHYEINEGEYGILEFKATVAENAWGLTDYNFCIYVVNDVYDVWMRSEGSRENGFPGETIELHAEGSHQYIDDNGDYQEDLDGYDFRWTINDGDDFASIVVDQTDPSHATLTFADEATLDELDKDWRENGLDEKVKVVVDLVKTGEEESEEEQQNNGLLGALESLLGIGDDGDGGNDGVVASNDRDFWLSTWFTELQPLEIKELDEGDSTTETFKIRQYDYFKEVEEGQPKYDEFSADSYEFGFDEDAIKVSYEKKSEGGNDGESGQPEIIEVENGDQISSGVADTFTITKLQNWGTELRVKARWKNQDEWNEWDDERENHYWLGQKDYRIWFDHNDDVVYRDEDVVFNLMSEDMPEGAVISYDVRRGNNGELPANTYTVNAEKNTVTVHGAALAELADPIKWVKIRAKATYNTKTIATSYDEKDDDDWTYCRFENSDWEPVLYAFSSEGESYDDGDTLYIEPGSKVFVAFDTEGNANLRHGVAPIVGWYDTIPDQEGDLSKLGFEVKAGTAGELGYAGEDIDSNITGIEIDPADLALGTTGTLRYALHEYDGEDFWGDWNSGRWSWASEVYKKNELNVTVAANIDFNNYDENNDPPLYFNGSKTYQITIPQEAEALGNVEFHAGAIGDEGFDPFIDLTAPGYSNKYGQYADGNLTLSGNSIYSDENFDTLYEVEKDVSRNLHIRAWIKNDEGAIVAIGHANCLVKRPETGTDLSKTDVDFVDNNGQSLPHLEDEKYSTPEYAAMFYVSHAGQTASPVVKANGVTMEASGYNARYSKVEYVEVSETKSEWQLIDESVWSDTFPTSPGVYLCEIDAVAPNYGLKTWIDLIKVEDHSWDEGSVTTDPTCTEKGVKTFHCSKCNATRTEDVDALGHNWSTVTYSPTQEGFDPEKDGETVTASRTCSRCSEVENETKTMSKTTTAASCTSPGSVTYTAVFGNEAFGTWTTTRQVDSVGHSWGEVVYAWSADNHSVTASRTCSLCKENETEEAGATSNVTKAATCTGKGETTYEATFLNEAFAAVSKTVDDIDALGHDLVHHTAQAPTCTDIGWDAYDTCSRCDYTTYEEQAALGHDYEQTVYDWEKDGDAWKCTATVKCKRDAAHAETETATTSNGKVTSAVKTQATCESKGTTAYTATFVNDLFGVRTKDVEDIPAKGHTWGAVSYTWKENNSKVEAKRTCSACNKVEQETVATTSEVTTAPTCEAEGVVTYTTKTFVNAAFTAQTKTETAAATGHDWGAVTYAWNKEGDVWKCTATRTCKNDKNDVQTETVESAIDAAVDPTCTNEGSKTYKATFTMEGFAPQTKTEVTPATGHAWGDWRETKQPTETVPGEEERVCTNDANHKETRSIPVVAHQHGLVRTAAMAPTCTETGNIEYWTCSDGENPCGNIFSDADGNNKISQADTVTSALGHNWGTPTYEKDAYGSVTAKRICANDEKHVQSEVGKTTTEITAPTCTTKGKTTYYVAFENNNGEGFTYASWTDENIPATGHIWREAAYEWTPDGDAWKCTGTRTCKNDASHTDTAEATVTSKTSTTETSAVKVTETTYTATFNKDGYETQTKTVSTVEAKDDKTAEQVKQESDAKKLSAEEEIAAANAKTAEINDVIDGEVDPAVLETQAVEAETAIEMANDAVRAAEEAVAYARAALEAAQKALDAARAALDAARSASSTSVQNTSNNFRLLRLNAKADPTIEELEQAVKDAEKAEEAAKAGVAEAIINQAKAGSALTSAKSVSAEIAKRQANNAIQDAAAAAQGTDKDAAAKAAKAAQDAAEKAATLARDAENSAVEASGLAIAANNNEFYENLSNEKKTEVGILSASASEAKADAEIATAKAEQIELTAAQLALQKTAEDLTARAVAAATLADGLSKGAREAVEAFEAAANTANELSAIAKSTQIADDIVNASAAVETANSKKTIAQNKLEEAGKALKDAKDLVEAAAAAALQASSVNGYDAGAAGNALSEASTKNTTTDTAMSESSEKEIAAETKQSQAESNLDDAERGKEAADTAAANAVVDKINALPAAANVTIANKTAIEAARAAYDALTGDQKAKINAVTLKRLTDAEVALSEAEKKETEDANAAAQAEKERIAADEAAKDAEFNGVPDGSVPKVKSVKAKAAKKSIKVTWTKAKGKNLKKFAKVEVQWSTSKLFPRKDSKYKILGKNKKSYKITGLKKGTYYVRVANIKYVNGVKKTSKWTVKKVKVKK